MINALFTKSKCHDWEAVRFHSETSPVIVAARVTLYLAGIALLTALTLGTVVATRQLRAAIADEHTIATKIGLDADEAHRLILEAGLTAMEARKASAEERKDLQAQNAAVTGLIESLTATSNSVRESQAEIARQAVSTLQAGQTVIAGLAPVERDLDGEVIALKSTTKDADALLADPDIKSTVAHLDAAAGNVQDMSADAKAKVHSILHPKIWTQVVNVTERVAVDVGKVMF